MLVPACWLLVSLLSQHILLQGMAMGAQTNIVDSVHIFIAIAAHKGLAAYALGSSVVDSQVCGVSIYRFCSARSSLSQSVILSQDVQSKGWKVKCMLTSAQVRCL